MAHDFLKIGLTLVILALVVAAVAFFVSGYLSAYKPGGKGTQSPVVSGGKSGGAAVPSPSAVANATPRAVQQYARYMPPGPVIPEAPVPPLQTEGGMLPPAGWQCPSPVAATPGPKYGVPAMPSAPGISGIIQILFRLLPLIFSHHYDLTPIWPP